MFVEKILVSFNNKYACLPCYMFSDNTPQIPPLPNRQSLQC